MLTKLEKPEEIISIEETADIIIALLPIYRKLNEFNDKKKINQIKAMLRPILYTCSEGREADFISRKAKHLWQGNKYLKKSNLFYLTPNIRRREKNKKNYSTLKHLLLEHCNPLSQIMSHIFENCNTKKQIKTFLRKELKTAWITKKENKELNKSGYKQSRFPTINGNKKKREEKSDWKKCYKQCKIEIIKR